MWCRFRQSFPTSRNVLCAVSNRRLGGILRWTGVERRWRWLRDEKEIKWTIPCMQCIHHWRGHVVLRFCWSVTKNVIITPHFAIITFALLLPQSCIWINIIFFVNIRCLINSQHMGFINFMTLLPQSSKSQFNNLDKSNILVRNRKQYEMQSLRGANILISFIVSFYRNSSARFVLLRSVTITPSPQRMMHHSNIR